jgi:SAM-dependent methyltransferase/mannose-6-phosphate isomerase-like protein (cupin superfamily)
MPYIHTPPTSASFTGKGLLGYSFGPLSQKDLEIYYIEVEKGHDTFMVSRKIKRTYYVLAGSGYFTIENRKYDVRPGMLVEVPTKVEFSYSGKMTLIAFSKPRWFSGNDTHTRWNPDVVRSEAPCGAGRVSWLTRLVRWRIFGKSPVDLFLRLNWGLWNRLPSSVSSLGLMRSYGNFLNLLARTRGLRGQAFSTFFLRNRPELELIRRLLEPKRNGETLKVAVLGCSTGAQAYSVAWRIRSARPDLKLILHAVDISKQAVEFAKQGVYSLRTAELTNTEIFDRMTTAEMEELFDIDGEVAAVKSWIKEGIQWGVADAGEPEILDLLGRQDMVVANNFLCHMDAPEAERSLRNIGRLVSPGGYLFVSGIDLDVRTKVALESGWNPVQELLEEIHDGDPSCKSFWPCHYAGLEPFTRKRRDWRTRYAAAFQPSPAATAPPTQSENRLEIANSRP